MPLRNEYVAQSVVVVIDELGAPPGVLRRNLAHPGLAGNVFEERALVAEQSVALMSQGIDEDVRKSIVAVVGEVGSHASERPSVLVVRHPRKQCDLFKLRAL